MQSQVDLYRIAAHCWHCCDVKKELLDRGVTPPKFATKGQLIRLLEKVLGEDEKTVLFPGHGPATTVGEEKKHNPFID